MINLARVRVRVNVTVGIRFRVRVRVKVGVRVIGLEGFMTDQEMQVLVSQPSSIKSVAARP
jgi:hypothetical protein